MILGLAIVMIYQTLVGSIESIFGGWEMLSEDYLKMRAVPSIGLIIVVTGIVIMIPGIFLKKKKDLWKKKDFLEERYAKGELSKGELESMKSVNAEQVETHIEILKERYANGEITKEEFENMKKDLENS